MIRHVTIATLALVGVSAVHADGLNPVDTTPADVRLCYASGSSGPQVPCVLQNQTWRQLLRPNDSADALTATPSSTAPAGTLAKLVVPSYGLGLSTSYMPPPSNDAAVDAANFAAAQATGARLIVFQSGIYRVPPAGYAQLRSDQNIAGQGRNATTLLLTGQGTSDGVLYGNEKSNISISDLTIDYNDFPEPTTGSAVLGFRNGNNILINNVDILNYSRFGFNLNAGSDIAYTNGRIIRSANPRNSAGAAIPLGQQNQCVLVSENISNTLAPINRVTFQDIYCKGSSFDVSGADVDYIRTVVDGFDFGFAYVTEQGANSRRHRFRDVRALNGRTNPNARVVAGRSVGAYKDDNDTSAGCLEIWSPETTIDGAICDNLGGDGVSLGGQNSRVMNSRFTRLGMQVLSNGIVARHEEVVDKNGITSIYNASGSYVFGNSVVDTKQSGDGSNLYLSYSEQSIAADMKITIGANDFGATSFPRKGESAFWSAPGMLVSTTTQIGYTHPSGTRQSPVAITIPGVVQVKDVILGATFRAADGSALPYGLRLSALVDADNDVRFYIEDISGGNSSFAIPAGTYSARLITVN